MTQKRNRIVWTDEEWFDIFNFVLQRRAVDSNQSDEVTLAAMKGDPGHEGSVHHSEVVVACKALFCAERQRDIRTTAGLYSPSMEAAFSSWKIGKSIPQGIVVEHLVPEVRSAQHTEKTKVTTRSRSYNDDQWQEICSELMRRMPLTMNSSTLVGVHVADIDSAARSLWPDRPIPTYQISAARSVLLECVIRARSASAEVIQPAISPMEALMKSLTEELAKGLAPTLARLEASIVERIRGEFSNLLRDALRGTGGPVEASVPAAKSVKIAIVGGYNKPHQLEQTLTSKFPSFKFILLGRDPHNYADAVKHCDLVLCNLEGISHSTARGIKTAAKEDAYRQFTGGESQLLRVLDTYTKTH